MADEKPTRVELLPPDDPTKNVMDLVIARSAHLQDLISNLETRMDKTFTIRDSLRAKEFDQIKEGLDQVHKEIKVRESHSKELAAKEQSRLDAIREIDGNNLTAAVERAQTEARMLAKAVEQAADTRRTALAELATHLDTRMGRIETYQNEMRGRQGLSTPLVAVIAAITGALLGFVINLVYQTIAHMKV